VRLRRSRPDFVVSSWTQDNVLVTLAFLFSSTKVVLVEHSSWHFHRPAIRLLRTMVYPFADELVVLNRRDLDHYRRYLPRVRLIPDPVTAEPIAPRSREKLIIAIGHLEPLKNFEDGIRAMALSRLENRGWSLAIIGSGSCEGRLRELIARLGLTRTTIHPPAADLTSWYAKASLLLVTSRLESFSLVLAEAMLSGVVPIAYASDGPCFILEDFPVHLVEMSNAEALSERVAKFANAPELERLRPRMRMAIEKRFAPAVVTQQWQVLLQPSPCGATEPC